MQTITFACMSTRIGVLRVGATAHGVCKIALGNETEASWTAWLNRYVHPDGIVERETGWVAQAVAQIAEYLAGQRRTFDVPLDMRGTDFQRAVWKAVATIPYGHTRTYVEIAAAIGRPTANRAVGAANGANPLPLIIPCHRVIGRSGALTGYGGGLDVKRILLELEQA